MKMMKKNIKKKITRR